MATTNRLRLLGRGLVEQGVGVTVLVARADDRPDAPLNLDIRGSVDGIRFLYTPGTTLRSEYFLMRRIRDTRGFAFALVELARLRRLGILDCAYLSLGASEWKVGVSVWAWSLYLLRVPFVVELNERPWQVSRTRARLSRWTSQLAATSGAVVISSYLARWAAVEAEQARRDVAVLEVPIIVDMADYLVDDSGNNQPLLVYSASNGYTEALSFILRAMAVVWSRRPDSRLVVTGMQPDWAANVVSQLDMRDFIRDGRIVLAGYLPRGELMSLYSRAAALLAPLFDDVVSQARFPTKLGEYLASGRPVVSNDVGEVDRYVSDGKTAFLSPAGDVAAYADRIVQILDDTASALAVARAGQRVAAERFDYRLHAPRLHTFLDSVAARRTR